MVQLKVEMKILNKINLGCDDIRRSNFYVFLLKHLATLSHDEVSSQRRFDNGLLENIAIMNWYCAGLSRPWINDKSCWSAICKSRQHCIFAKKKCWDVVFFKHQFCELLSLWPHIPLYCWKWTNKHQQITTRVSIKVLLIISCWSIGLVRSKN